jgi:hypothetical protein
MWTSGSAAPGGPLSRIDAINIGFVEHGAVGLAIVLVTEMLLIFGGSCSVAVDRTDVVLTRAASCPLAKVTDWSTPVSVWLHYRLFVAERGALL